MAATELQNRSAAVEEANVTELSVKVAEQVSEILKEAAEWKRIPQPTLVYRIPSPGVRCYF
jgi:hypothetical protein